MKKANEQNFLQAYEAHADALFRYCYLRIRDRERAQDLMHETFTKTWEYLRAGNEIQAMRPFLYRVAHNLTVNEAVRSKTVSLDELQETVGYDPEDVKALSPEEDAEASMLMNRLLELSETDREALTLRYVEGMRVADIAKHLDEPPNTVSVRIHRALARLRELSGTP